MPVKLLQNEITLLAQLGYTLYKEGQFAKAIMIFEGLAELEPNTAQFHSALVVLYHLTNRREDALRAGMYAMRLNPKDVALLITVGEVYLSLNQSERAREVLNRAFVEARQIGHPAIPRIALLLRRAA